MALVETPGLVDPRSRCDASDDTNSSPMDFNFENCVM